MIGRVLALGALVVALSGCMPGSAAGVRQKGPEHQFSFEVKENYQSVYMKVADHARQCFGNSLITASTVVLSDLLPDLKQGTVSVAMSGVGGMSYMQVIDIKATADGGALVVAHYSGTASKQWGGLLKRAVTEGDTSCVPSRG